MGSQISRGVKVTAGATFIIATNDYATLQVFAPTAGDGPNMITAVENLDGSIGPVLLSWKANATGIGTPVNDASGAVFDQLPTTYDVSGLFNVVIKNNGGTDIIFDYGLSDSKLNIPSSGGSIPNPLPVTFAEPITIEGVNDYTQAIGVGGRNYVTGNFEVENNWNGNALISDVVYQAPFGFPQTVASGGGVFAWGQVNIADDYEDQMWGIIDVSLAPGATLLVQGQTILGPNVNLIVTNQMGSPVASSLITATGVYLFLKMGMAAVTFINNGTGDVTVNFAGLGSGTPPVKFF